MTQKTRPKLIFFIVIIALIIGGIIALGTLDFRPKSELLSVPADASILN